MINIYDNTPDDYNLEFESVDDDYDDYDDFEYSQEED